MIKRWRLRNFKSFRDLPPLDLAPINVLAGANSSGKSTIIQSILLLKQSLQYGPENRSIAFNGPLLRLGAFHDVRHSGASNEAIHIGFDIEPEDTNTIGLSSIPWSRIMRRGLATAEKTIRTISIDLSYLVDTEESALALPSNATLTPTLVNATLNVDQVTDNNINSSSYAKFVRKLEPVTGTDDTLSPPNWRPYEASLDSSSEEEITSDKPDASILGGVISYFLPKWVAVHFNSSKQNAAALAKSICEPSHSVLASNRLFDDYMVPPSVIAVVNDWLVKHSGDLLLGTTAIAAGQSDNSSSHFSNK